MWYVLLLLMLPNIYASSFLESAGCVFIEDENPGWNCSDVDLSNAEIMNFDFTGVDFTRANLTGANLVGAKGKLAACPSDFLDFLGYTWKCINKYLIGAHADLMGADLTDANLTGMDLTGTDLTDADLSNADVSGVKGKIWVCPSDFDDKYGVTWKCRNRYLVGPGADLSNVDLTGADLTGADLSNADLTGADLTGADLTGVKGELQACPSDFVDINNNNWKCRNRYLIGPGATLTGADLSNADLAGAELTGADLTDVDLTGADLTGADLHNVNLTNINLQYAKLYGVTGLDLSGALNVENANIGCAYGKLYDSNGDCVVVKEALIKVYRESECN